MECIFLFCKLYYRVGSRKVFVDMCVVMNCCLLGFFCVGRYVVYLMVEEDGKIYFGLECIIIIIFRLKMVWDEKFIVLFLEWLRYCE